MAPWILFNVNILGVRAWIVTDQVCWITEREDDERGRGRLFEGGVNLNISVKVGDCSREVINRGTAITGGNTIVNKTENSCFCLLRQEDREYIRMTENQ